MESDILSKPARQQLSVISNKTDYIITSLLVSLVYVAATFKFGQGVTFDSVNYLSAASTIDEGMKKSDGTLFYEWPPLFPLILSLYKTINISPLLFSTIITIIVLNANVLIATYILKITLHNKLLLLICTLIIIFSTPLLQVHVILWSEPIFILLIILNILFLKKYFDNGNLRHLLLITLLGVLLCLQRKSGIYFIAANAILLLLNKSTKIRHFIIYIGLCATPILGWFLRRKSLSGKYFGSASWDSNEISNVLKAFSDTFTSHFLPSNLNLHIRLAIIFSILILLTIIIYKHKLLRILKENKLIHIAFSFVVIYYSLLIISLFAIHISEKIDDRILSPAYLPLTITIIYSIDFLCYQFRDSRKWVTLFFSLSLFLWLGYTITRTMHHIHRWNTDGTGGYNTLNWQSNPIIRHLANSYTTDTIITNEVEALTYHLNFRANKNSTILGSDTLIKNNSRCLFVCFKKNEVFQPQWCNFEKEAKKNIILGTKEGMIWIQK